jgi:hypothetical protein
MRMEREAAQLSSRLHSDTMQIDRMRLLQVQAQLYVVPPSAPHLEGGPLAVRGVHRHARKQHATTPCMHTYVCEACAQQPSRSADAALPAGVPVERTTRVCIVDGREY